MKAVVYEEFRGKPFLADVADPTPSNDGVVIEVKACGVCRSDWWGWQGHDSDIELPHVPGHEITGVVSEVGKDVTKWKGGERVTLPFVGGCGECRLCKSGNQQVCENQFQPGFTGWGGFAEYVAIDYADENLVSLPESLGYSEASSLGCRFTTAYRAIVYQGAVKPGKWVTVFGCGGVGLSAIMIASALGAKTIAVDIRSESLALAKMLGAQVTVNSRDSEDVVSEIKELTKGGSDVSLDCIGSGKVVLDSLNSLKKLGRHVQVGLLEGDESALAIPVNLFVAREIKFVGSHGLQAHKYDEVFELIKKSLDLSLLLASEITLEQAVDALINMDNFHSRGVSVINPTL